MHKLTIGEFVDFKELALMHNNIILIDSIIILITLVRISLYLRVIKKYDIMMTTIEGSL